MPRRPRRRCSIRRLRCSIRRRRLPFLRPSRHRPRRRCSVRRHHLPLPRHLRLPHRLCSARRRLRCSIRRLRLHLPRRRRCSIHRNLATNQRHSGSSRLSRPHSARCLLPRRNPNRQDGTRRRRRRLLRPRARAGCRTRLRRWQIWIWRRCPNRNLCLLQRQCLMSLLRHLCSMCLLRLLRRLRLIHHPFLLRRLRLMCLLRLPWLLCLLRPRRRPLRRPRQPRMWLRLCPQDRPTPMVSSPMSARWVCSRAARARQRSW